MGQRRRIGIITHRPCLVIEAVLHALIDIPVNVGVFFLESRHIGGRHGGVEIAHMADNRTAGGFFRIVTHV